MAFIFPYIEYLATLMEFMIFFWCSSLILSMAGTKRKHFCWRVFFSGATYLIIITIGNILFPVSLIAVYIYYFAFCALLYFIYQSDWSLIFLSAMIAFLICHTCDLTVNLIIGPLFGSDSLYNSFWSVISPGLQRLLFMMTDTMIKICIILAFHKLGIFKNIQYVTSFERRQMLLLSAGAHIILIVTNFLLMEQSQLLHDFAVVLEEVSLLSIAMVGLYTIEKKSELHLTQERMDLFQSSNEMLYESQIQQSEALDSAYKQAHEYRHTLQALLAKDDIGPQSRLYIQDLFDHSAEVKKIAASGDPFIDAVINSHAQDFHKHDIDFRYSSTLAAPLPYNPVDIVSLTANLLENAIHACRQIGDDTKKWINLSVSQNKGFTVIVVDNSISDHMTTTPSDTRRHGYGIEIIKSIVANNHGFYNVKKDEHMYSARILLQYMGDLQS